MTGGQRGRYTIYLGMAAGVGKTYRMLQEGLARAEAGEDVAIGFLETHGRADTAALADGLERLPRRRVTYRDTVLEELDLPAILGRAPEVCLIDELAHTNAPGVGHHKRYEDIDEVLGAGIEVLSTVNVQHLESLNDQVAELTGKRRRLDKVRRERDSSAVAAALARVRTLAAEPDVNLMPAFIEAARAYATLGEIIDALGDVFGRWVEAARI